MREKNEIVNVDRAWNDLCNRLRDDNLLDAVEARKLRRHLWLKLAAFFTGITLAGMAVFLYWKTERPFAPSFVSENNRENVTLVSTLTDGSVVYLVDGGILNYPPYFEKDKREVSLTGEALFEVSGNPERPFIIETAGVIVEVIGTVFNIKSLPEEENFELYVQQGRVDVTCKKGGSRVTVHAGEFVRLYKGAWQKGLSSDIDLYSLYAVKMRFKDEELSVILPVLNRAGDHPIVLKEPEVGKRRMTVTFPLNRSEVMAELICSALNLHYTVEQDTIYISNP